MKTLAAMIFCLAMIASACEDPAANRPRAVTSDASLTGYGGRVPETAAFAELKGTPLAIGPGNSKVGFIGSKVTGRHVGGFKSFSGTIDLVNDDPEESRVAIEIEMPSVYTDEEGLTKHLQTSDFFDAAKYPKSSFVSSKITAEAADGDGRYTVTGDLELRGQRRSITFPATISVTPESVAVFSEFAVSRKDFGIVYAGKADDLIRDDVVITLDLRSPRGP